MPLLVACFFFEGAAYYSFGTPSSSYPTIRRFKPIDVDGALGQDDGMYGWRRFTSTGTMILPCVAYFNTAHFAMILQTQDGGGSPGWSQDTF